MVLGSGVVFLMDGDDSVNDFRGNGLFVDDWLDSLVDVMVNMLALDSWCGGSGVSSFVSVGGVFELSSFTLELEAGLIVVVVVELLLDGVFHDMVMLLGEDLLMLDGLDSGVVVILVDLTVDGLGDFLMASGLDILASNGGSNALGHIGCVASLVGKAGNCSSGFIHFEDDV